MTLESRVDTVNGTVSNAQQVAQPLLAAVQASGAVDAIKSGLNSFMEDIPWLMKSLDEVAKIHPFVTGTHRTGTLRRSLMLSPSGRTRLQGRVYDGDDPS